MLPTLVLAALAAAPPTKADLVQELTHLGASLAAPDLTPAFRRAREALYEAGVRESKLWRSLKDRAAWEKHRDQRIAALRGSLGRFPKSPTDLKVKVEKTRIRDDYAVECLTFESRPGLRVTANLYRPETPGKAMPGLILVHSHHNPKTEGELQDMGVLWAKAGCCVLVMDQIGHGERRQHPFRTAADYPASYRVGRQDYFFRYNLAVQLQTIGDGLMGWMVWDLMRGVDLLLKQPGIDPKKIAILGAVAGGGDPAAVAAALDNRITAAVVFNFGGPQPETRYPLPENAEESFLYTGGGSWESTRNLAGSASGGYLPWVIVGAIAPRRHVHAHEFRWDDKRDPVWRRLRQIHTWYGTPNHLASARGDGSVSGRSPESTHCNNIGPVHRKGIHEAFKRWFGIDAREPENRNRHSAEDLACVPKGEKLELAHRLAAKLGQERADEARQRRAKLPEARRREALKNEWARLLGGVEVRQGIRSGVDIPRPLGEGMSVRWLRSDVSDGAALILAPRVTKGVPTIVATGQGGVGAFLKHRADEIAKLLRAGNVIVLTTLGEANAEPPGSRRGRQSGATSLASSQLMLGQPVLGEQLRLLRAIYRTVRTLPEVDPARVSLWGDSFAMVNDDTKPLRVPLELSQPAQAEPNGSTLALLCALFEPGVHSVRARGGLVGYASLLGDSFVHLPYDAVVPGALTTGDMVDVVAALAPREVRLEGLVDGLNRRVPAAEVERMYAPARVAYRAAKAEKKLLLASAPTARKKIVLIAGKKSHGPVGNGIHDYGWSVRLLKAMLENSDIKDRVRVETHLAGWPRDPSTLDDADTIMVISDGRDGDRYEEAPHLASPERVRYLEKQIKRGCGFLTFHFSTFAPNRYSGEVLRWSGGYFQWETEGKRQWYSAITTKEAEVTLGAPGHPVSRGLTPFTMREEFYFNLRFPAEERAIQPIWVVPTLGGRKPDGNVVAWARERPDGGRGFGTTCGHFYDNWRHDNFRKLILNALAWTAKIDVPPGGIEARYYTHEDIDDPKKRDSLSVLLVAGNEAHKWHNWEKTTPRLKAAMEADARVQVDVVTDFEELGNRDLSRYQSVLMNWCNWHDAKGPSEKSKQAFAKFVRDGGGLVLVHFANGAFHASLPKAGESDWLEYRKIVRRVWDHRKRGDKLPSGHDAFGRFTVIPTKVIHPLTEGLNRFEVEDELYFRQDGDEPIEPLLVAESKVTKKLEPLAWTYRYGKGRVFQTLLGHSEKTYDASETREMIRRAALWTAGLPMRAR